MMKSPVQVAHSDGLDPRQKQKPEPGPKRKEKKKNNK